MADEQPDSAHNTDDNKSAVKLEPHPAIVPGKTQVGRHGTKIAGQKLAVLVAGVVVVVGVVAFVVVGHKGSDSKKVASQQQTKTMFDYNKCLKDTEATGKDATAAGAVCQDNQRKYNAAHGIVDDTASGGDLGDPGSTDPLTRGKALGYGQCTGTGSAKLTHAPMDMKDVETIQPMGLTIGAHVTPVDHEYYYQKNPSAAANTYPVYAVMDGTITGAGHVGNAWAVFLSHSCTFYADYNLMTDLTDEIKAQLPAGWGPNSNGNVKIPVKSGQLIGYVGGQSLDFAVWDTTKTLKGFLNPVAYNNAEPWKINTVHPLDYFTDTVKQQVLTRYVRTAEPRDGKIDYDVNGQAVGNWFQVGTDGYAGGDQGTSSQTYFKGHLALAYDYIDPTALTFSIGDYQGAPTQFAVKGSVDWTKITPTSGVAKVELAQRQYTLADGSKWNTKYATGIKMVPGPSQATVLLQMTDKQVMKVEVFPGKTPAQVSDFSSAAVLYNRGQDAHMPVNTTATP